MGPNGPRFELMYNDGATYKGQISSKFKLFLLYVELIWEHPDPYMSTISLDLYLNMVFVAIFFATIDLKMPRDRCMHPMRSTDREWSNLDIPCTQDHPRGHTIIKSIRYHGDSIENTYCYWLPLIVTQSIWNI